MKPKISLVTLGVRDFKAAKAFYEGLGFPVGATDDVDFAMFKLEGTWLALFPKDKLAFVGPRGPTARGAVGCPDSGQPRPRF